MFTCKAGLWSRLCRGTCKPSGCRYHDTHYQDHGKFLHQAPVSPTTGYSCSSPGSFPGREILLKASQWVHAEVLTVPKFPPPYFYPDGYRAQWAPKITGYCRSGYACRFACLLYPILTPPCFHRSTKPETKTVVMTIIELILLGFFVVQHQESRCVGHDRAAQQMPIPPVTLQNPAFLLFQVSWDRIKCFVSSCAFALHCGERKAIIFELFLLRNFCRL